MQIEIQRFRIEAKSPLLWKHGILKLKHLLVGIQRQVLR